MKVFLTNISIVIITLVVAVLISLLLDWKFIQAHTLREILVYILVLVDLFIGFRILYLFNK